MLLFISFPTFQITLEKGMCGRYLKDGRGFAKCLSQGGLTNGEKCLDLQDFVM